MIGGAICIVVIAFLALIMLFFDGSARLEDKRRLNRLEGGDE